MTVWTINDDVTVICLDFNCTIKITQLQNSTILYLRLDVFGTT